MPRGYHPRGAGSGGGLSVAARIDRAKAEVDIVDVLAELGAFHSGSRPQRFNGWTPVRCPFHDDQLASGSINRAEARYRCHTCDISEDVIGVATLHLNTTEIVEALEWLEDRYIR